MVIGPNKHEGTLTPHSQSKPKLAVGILFAILGSALIGCTYLFSKVALATINTRTFIPLWMLTGGIYVAIAGALKGQITIPPSNFTRLGLVSLGIFEILGASSFFTAITMAPQPAIVAFLARFSVPIALILSLLILKERLKPNAVGGVILIIVGSLFLTYKSGSVGWVLLLLAGALSISGAASLIVGKKVVKQSNPFMMLITRNMVTALGVVLILPGSIQLPPLEIFGVILLGALFGPCCGFLCLYMALDRIDAWLVSVFMMTQPLFVSIYDWVFLGDALSPAQLVIGFMILFGGYLVIKSTVGSSVSVEAI
jgi:drug/metabolite transporter (DMT)-like permease